MVDKANCETCRPKHELNYGWSVRYLYIFSRHRSQSIVEKEETRHQLLISFFSKFQIFRFCEEKSGSLRGGGGYVCPYSLGNFSFVLLLPTPLRFISPSWSFVPQVYMCLVTYDFCLCSIVRIAKYALSPLSISNELNSETYLWTHF
jgi:hypothetical protein